MAKSAFEKFVDAKLEEQKKCLMEEATREYLGSLPSYDIRLADFVGQMKEDGIWDTVEKMTLVEIASVVYPPAARKGGRSRRLTKVEKETILAKIPEFLDRGGWLKKREIAKAIGVEPRKLTGPLRELADAKKIKKHGEKGATKYAATGEKSKPE